MALFSARVYSVEPLAPERKRGVADGLDIIGEQIGGITVKKHSIVTHLPMGKDGINPGKVGYKNFDPRIDLHLFVAPISQNTGRANVQRLGLSYYKSGVSWVSDRESPEMTATTTAHEAAHAFGYVLIDAPQTISAESAAHCSSDGCIMAASVEDVDSSPLLGNFSSGLLRDVFGVEITALPNEFCTPCRADIRDTIDDNIATMRATRHLVGGVTSLSIRP